jgi:hypothetical protein
MSDSRQTELSGIVRKAHTILGVMWPRPGVPSMANARDFIPNKVFEHSRSALRRASELAMEEDGPRLRECLLACKETAEWLAANHERLPEAVSVDPFVNLLFLATGLASNKLDDLKYTLPSWAENESLRPVEELLQVCAWTGETGTIDQLLENVRIAVETEVQNLRATSIAS